MRSRVAAIFDVDGTLFNNPSTERRFIKYLLQRGKFPPKAYLNFLLGAIILLPKGISTVLKGNKYYLRGWSVEDEAVTKACRSISSDTKSNSG